MTGPQIRVVIADDEPLIRAGIRMILTSDREIDVVAEAANGREAVELARSHAVDVVLLDIQMPEMDGLSALAELRRTVPATRVIILTTFGERENVLRALEHGGAGFLLKDTAPAELIRAVRAAAAGDAYLSPGATRHVVDQLATGRAAARAEEARRRVGVL
ncbi:response regulator transcription factor, partial [Streptomyces hundungensis]